MLMLRRVCVCMSVRHEYTQGEREREREREGGIKRKIRKRDREIKRYTE